jgi:hypothetical protein
LVLKNEAGSFTRGEQLVSSIADTDPARPVSMQALALLEIQAGRYSEAWKHLVSKPSANQNSALQAGNDRLKLWLLLEAHSCDKAEGQFKRLVVSTIGTRTESKDLADTIEFLGGVIGFAEFQPHDSCVSMDVLEKARIALGKVKSPNTLHGYNTAHDSAVAWGEIVEAQIASFKDMDREQRAAKEATAVQQLAAAQEELLRVRTLLRELAKAKRTIQQDAKQQLRELSPDRFPPPSFPREPSQAYQKDETASEARRRDREYDLAMQKYRTDLEKFPQRLAAWQEMQKKRAEILAKNLRLNQEQASNNDAAMAVAQQRQKVAAELVGGSIARLHLVKRIRSVIESDGIEAAGRLRPSYFKLIDYERETVRLKTCLP